MTFSFKHSKIFCLGDIHGNFWELMRIAENVPNDSLLIQVGDFGVGFNRGFEDMILKDEVNPHLQKRNITLVAIRGNHDNPSLFTGQIHSNIYLVPDYTTIHNGTTNIFLVGGGISIDRRMRKVDKDYWSNEGMGYSPQLLPDAHIDILVTHATSSRANPHGSDFSNIAGFLRMDPSLKPELANEANMCECLFQAIKPKKWLFGHYHKAHTIDLDGSEVTCLGIDELKEV